MCGITGIIQFDRLTSGSAIAAMTAAIRHRGPDDEGYIGVHPVTLEAHAFSGPDSQVSAPAVSESPFQAGIWLGHRRLSVIDTSPAGHQPQAAGEVWLVFNGEIYNHIELREELGGLGHVFKTATDTEVFLHAYRQWGTDCLSHFNGMWAFLLLDLGKRRLWGARDITGVKPLFYSRQGDFILFASEIKAILAVPGSCPQVDSEYIFDILAFGQALDLDHAPFLNIRELPPAHEFLVAWPCREMNIRAYYRPVVECSWRKRSPAEWQQDIAATRERILSSVDLRLRSDVAIGTALSGGLDSSVIVAAVRHLTGQRPVKGISGPLKCFTACFPGKKIDESAWAKAVAKATGSDWIPVFPTLAGFLDDLPALIHAQESPFSSPSLYAQFAVMRAARQNGVVVMLDGQGGDELFSGYSIYYPVFLYETWKSGTLRDWFREWRGLANAPSGRWETLSGSLRLGIKNGLPPGLLAWWRRRHPLQATSLDPDFRSPFFKRSERLAETNYTQLNPMLADFYFLRKLDHLLRFEDHNSMHFGIEARTPFADDRGLFEFAFRLPSSSKIHQGWSKYLVRQAMKDLLPPAIINRRDKIGFAAPDREWLVPAWQRFFPGIRPYLKEFLGPEALDRDWSRRPPRHEGELRSAWSYLTLGLWYHDFIASRPHG